MNTIDVAKHKQTGPAATTRAVASDARLDVLEGNPTHIAATRAVASDARLDVLEGNPTDRSKGGGQWGETGRPKRGIPNTCQQRGAVASVARLDVLPTHDTNYTPAREKSPPSSPLSPPPPCPKAASLSPTAAPSIWNLTIPNHNSSLSGLAACGLGVKRSLTGGLRLSRKAREKNQHGKPFLR